MTDRTQYQLELAGFGLVTVLVWVALLRAAFQVLA